MKIITCVTDTPRFHWEVHVLLQNLKEFNLSDKVAVLIFQLRDYIQEDFSPDWKELQKKFPETEFVFYKDTNNITRICNIFHYLPLFRLWVLEQFFKDNKYLEKEAIFYIDSDIILTKPIDFEKYIHDDINYLSWTGSPERTDNYLWQPYFDSKIKMVHPARLEQYKKLDVLSKVAKICNTTREAVTANSMNIGGAQYLLKNVTSQFWTDCFNRACEIKLYLANINQIYMQGKNATEKENNGFQSWCADMWAVLFSLFGDNRPVQCPKEFDFAWSCDRIDRLETTAILHNAGITSEEKIRVAFEKLPDGTNRFEDAPTFYKGKYEHFSPLEDVELLEELYNNPLNKKFCNNKYVEALLKIKQ